MEQLKWWQKAFFWLGVIFAVLTLITILSFFLGRVFGTSSSSETSTAQAAMVDKRGHRCHTRHCKVHHLRRSHHALVHHHHHRARRHSIKAGSTKHLHARKHAHCKSSSPAGCKGGSLDYSYDITASGKMTWKFIAPEYWAEIHAHAHIAHHKVYHVKRIFVETAVTDLWGKFQSWEARGVVSGRRPHYYHHHHRAVVSRVVKYHDCLRLWVACVDGYDRLYRVRLIIRGNGEVHVASKEL